MKLGYGSSNSWPPKKTREEWDSIDTPLCFQSGTQWWRRCFFYAEALTESPIELGEDVNGDATWWLKNWKKKSNWNDFFFRKFFGPPKSTKSAGFYWNSQYLLRRCRKLLKFWYIPTSQPLPNQFRNSCIGFPDSKKKNITWPHLIKMIREGNFPTKTLSFRGFRGFAAFPAHGPAWTQDISSPWCEHVKSIQILQYPWTRQVWTRLTSWEGSTCFVGVNAEDVNSCLLM